MSPAPAQRATVDIYQYAGECVIVLDSRSGKYIGRDVFGYSMMSLAGGATPFRMQATGLGSYLLYGPDGKMPVANVSGRVIPTTVPTPTGLVRKRHLALALWITTP